jgi:single-stranded DNA-binding protein
MQPQQQQQCQQQTLRFFVGLQMSTTPESLFGDLDEPISSSSSSDSNDDIGQEDTTTTNESNNYPTYDSIDWSSFNPLEGLSWEEYEQKYVYNIDGMTPQDELEWNPAIPTLNQLYVVGRVGNIGDLRYLGSSAGGDGGGGGSDPTNPNSNQNNVVIQLSIALPRYYNYWERKDFNIEYGQEETEWYNCEVWGQTAEFVSKNVRKGMRVGIIGAIDTDYYENRRDDAAGMLSTNCKVIVQDLDILESKMEADARLENQRGPSFYTNDDSDGGGGGRGRFSGGSGNDDDDDYDTYNPARGSSGGFFDP